MTWVVDLTSNFFVLCKNMKVYLYNYSKWVEPSMNIHEGMGLLTFPLVTLPVFLLVDSITIPTTRCDLELSAFISVGEK